MSVCACECVCVCLLRAARCRNSKLVRKRLQPTSALASQLLWSSFDLHRTVNCGRYFPIVGGRRPPKRGMPRENWFAPVLNLHGVETTGGSCRQTERLQRQEASRWDSLAGLAGYLYIANWCDFDSWPDYVCARSLSYFSHNKPSGQALPHAAPSLCLPACLPGTQ